MGTLPLPLTGAGTEGGQPWGEISGTTVRGDLLHQLRSTFQLGRGPLSTQSRGRQASAWETARWVGSGPSRWGADGKSRRLSCKRTARTFARLLTVFVTSIPINLSRSHGCQVQVLTRPGVGFSRHRLSYDTRKHLRCKCGQESYSGPHVCRSMSAFSNVSTIYLSICLFYICEKLNLLE